LCLFFIGCWYSSAVTMHCGLHSASKYHKNCFVWRLSTSAPQPSQPPFQNAPRIIVHYASKLCPYAKQTGGKSGGGVLSPSPPWPAMQPRSMAVRSTIHRRHLQKICGKVKPRMTHVSSDRERKQLLASITVFPNELPIARYCKVFS